ncbi:MAG TPA: hypothetical protein VGE26_09145 [Sphingobacteriaceae bacterium]
MHFEEVNTDWFNPNALRLPNYKVGRVSYGQGRSYIRINEDGSLEQPFRLYTSLTTAINTCAPTEKPLLEWYVKHGMAEADRLLKLAQHYGTLMHLIFGQYLMEGSFELETLKEQVENYTSEKNYWQPECTGWEEKLKYDLVAFVQFCQDYKVVPLGIEYVLLSQRGFGTLIDLVCNMTIEEKGFWGEVYKSGEKKGQPKETKRAKQITAVINFKSGRHQFYRSNGIQALAEKQLFEENFPDIKIDAAYNWSPKDWKTEPGYNLKDWNGEIEPGEVDAVMQLAEVRFAQKAINRRYLNIYGTIHKGDPVSALIHQESVEDFCMRKFGNTPMTNAKPAAAFHVSKSGKLTSNMPTETARPLVYTPAPLPI